MRMKKVFCTQKSSAKTPRTFSFLLSIEDGNCEIVMKPRENVSSNLILGSDDVLVDSLVPKVETQTMPVHKKFRPIFTNVIGKREGVDKLWRLFLSLDVITQDISQSLPDRIRKDDGEISHVG
jgi:hypothetical protein